MTTTIHFVSTNKGKIHAFEQHTQAFELQVVSKPLDLIEPQADTLQEVAIAKAKQAYTHLNAPVIVDDSGFGIQAFKGFPGAYTKYVVQTLGAEGLLQLNSSTSNRTCYFENVLVYLDGSDTPQVFTDKGTGRLSQSVDASDCPQAWSDLWRIFIPDGYNIPLCSFSPDQLQALYARWGTHSVYYQFADWWQSKE